MMVSMETRLFFEQASADGSGMKLKAQEPDPAHHITSHHLLWPAKAIQMHHLHIFCLNRLYSKWSSWFKTVKAFLVTTKVNFFNLKLIEQ